MRSRFLALAALLVVVVLAGLISLPVLQRCCSDPPLPAGLPAPSIRHLLDRVLFMDMVPRLAALAVAAGCASLTALIIVYGATIAMERREASGLSPAYFGLLRATAAAFVVGVFYLYGLFLTGRFQLGWLNLVWIFGVPTLLAALVRRDKFERCWGGLFLIVPGFVTQVVLMIALNIGN